MKKIELINLTLDEIRKACTTVDNVCDDTKHILHEEDYESLKKLVNDCEDVLNSVRVKLRDVLEEVVDYQNATDMLSGVDCALAKVPFDLIYERTSEDDY